MTEIVEHSHEPGGLFGAGPAHPLEASNLPGKGDELLRPVYGEGSKSGPGDGDPSGNGRTDE